MKNRDKFIIHHSEYDMLMQMQHNIMEKGCVCVLDALTGNMNSCPAEMQGKVGALSRLAVCGKCIQRFLNEEA